MQTFIDTRNDADQPMIDALAKDFLRPQDVRELEVALGRPPSTIQFRPAEYLYLNSIYPVPQNYRRRYMELFKFVLTIDRWLARLRGLYRTVVDLNEIASDSVYAMLRNELIHPSYIPWEAIEKTDMRKLDFVHQSELSLRNGNEGLPDALRASPDGSSRYLAQFPLIGSMIALTQGLYLENPELKHARWVNAGVPADNPARSWGQGGPFGLYDTERHLAIERQQARIKGGEEEEAKVQIPAMTPKILEEDRKGWYDGLQEWNGTGYICRDLALSFRRIGGISTLYNMFNKLMLTFQTVLAKSPMMFSRNPSFFVTDMVTGPMYGKNLECGPGHMPQFVGYDNQPVAPDKAMFEYKGHVYISSMVDPTKSSCAPMGIVREIDEKGMINEQLKLESRRRTKRAHRSRKSTR